MSDKLDLEVDFGAAKRPAAPTPGAPHAAPPHAAPPGYAQPGSLGPLGTPAASAAFGAEGAPVVPIAQLPGDTPAWMRWLGYGLVALLVLLVGRCTVAHVDRPGFLPLAYEVDGPNPAGASKLLVFLHGYGGSTDDVAWIGDELRKLGLPQDVSIVYVDGAYAGGGGRCWGDAEPELHTSVARVRALIEDLARGKQASQVYVAGFSQGAAVAQRIAMAGDVAKTGILLSGCRYERDPLKADRAVRYLFVHGRSDSLCSYGEAASIVEDFAGRGLDAELVSFDGNHVVPHTSQLEIVRVLSEAP